MKKCLFLDINGGEYLIKVQFDCNTFKQIDDYKLNVNGAIIKFQDYISEIIDEP